MKKALPISLSFLLLFSSNFLFAQKFKQNDHENFFHIGAKGGININKIQGQSYKSGFNYNYLLGGFMQFNFGRFGLQPEVNLVQSVSEFSKDANNVYNDLFYGGSQKKAKLNYIKVPLLLNINVGESKHVKLQVGPQFGGLLKQAVDSLKANKNLFKTSDFSAVGGVWFQLPFVNLGARYELGLSNVNDIDNKEKWKSQAFTVFVGFTL
ncbi:MAG: PorT family protein [Chitinophagaceae bacterium]|nr:PorT family protein [Chitinophagaceae bacterium]MDB5222924.1 PorT family protein [Chitinophagaceae bacterium]